ncbi:MAG: threonylcarbamoyl-AMP synthase [Candidatus Micrarchaeota archaeon]|nr:threonylcarbamoyl-AMP synthase [Candidatus Micrarchaeota archaeon]
MTEILEVNPVNPQMERIQRAAKIITSGGTVAFPTETVYGIGANAFDNDACAKIFKAKGRPADNPLIVHVASLAQLGDVASDVPDAIMKALKVVWPGPITLILKKADRMPDTVTASLETVAVRMPAHPVALRLIEASGVPIAAPSANASTRPSPSKASHVIQDLDGKVDMILDGGETAFGLESTIIDATSEKCRLLRPGAFTLEELERYFGKIDVPKSINVTLKESDIAIAPGMKYRHYAPKKMLVAAERDAITQAAEGLKGATVMCSDQVADAIGKHADTIRLGDEANLYEIAKNLFDALRNLDKTKSFAGVIQTFPERGIGFAIMNRVLKASGSKPATSAEELLDRLSR